MQLKNLGGNMFEYIKNLLGIPERFGIPEQIGISDNDVEDMDNFIEYKGFVRKMKDNFSLPAVLIIYDNGLQVVKGDSEFSPYYIVDKDQPEGKYMCENGTSEFCPSEEIE